MMIIEVHIIFLDNLFPHKYKLNIFTVVYCFIKIQKLKGCLEKKKVQNIKISHFALRIQIKRSIQMQSKRTLLQ